MYLQVLIQLLSISSLYPPPPLPPLATDPKKLTPLQQSRSVTVWYSGSSTFKVTFGHDGHITTGGRNILFAGPGIYCPPTPPSAPSTALN
jgi:hypothetical protein